MNRAFPRFKYAKYGNVFVYARSEHEGKLRSECLWNSYSPT